MGIRINKRVCVLGRLVSMEEEKVPDHMKKEKEIMNAQLLWTKVPKRAEIVCVGRGRCEYNQNAGALQRTREELLSRGIFL